MPLNKSCSLDAFKANIRASYKEGKTAKGTQHVAIALSTLKRACGVDDGDRKMSAKEIVAAGPKGESLVRLSTLFGNPGSSEVTERFGIDFAVRTSSPRGVGRSPNAATARPMDGGAFRVFADEGEIKSGDGRMPKISKPRLPKRKP